MSSTRDAFERFADEEARGFSPLYETLSRGVAGDDDLLTLAEEVPGDQPAPNLLFAAVQFLLFEDPGVPLAEYYPSVVGAASPPEEAVNPFRAFCLDRREELVSLLRSRRVQTNVVRRSSVLLPAFEFVSRRVDRTPLGLVEIGSSAGLNLCWDEYGYEYGGRRCGEPDSPVRLSCEVRGDRTPPIPNALPPVGTRLGIDLNTLDVRNEDDVEWLRALIWPEHGERRALIDGAVAVAHESPPDLVEGDALMELGNLCADVPEDEHLTIFNTHVLYQFTADQRAEFAAAVDELGARRDLSWLNCEWYGEDPEIHFVEYEGGEKSTAVLASYDSHGRWIVWRP